MFFAIALAFQSAARAADAVPALWNVSPITNGAYREAFDGVTLPAWAQQGATTNVPDATQTGATGRTNRWFVTSLKVMELDTGSVGITNTLTGANTYETDPIYVDMRVKFTAMSETPDPVLTDNVKLAIYLSADNKLVAVHATGVETDVTPRSTNTWYQLTVKMRPGGLYLYDVLIDDAAVFTNLTLKGGGTPNTLAGVAFNGAGRVDELYASHGDPKTATVGSTTRYPVPRSNSEGEQATINTWLDNNDINTLAMTEDQLNTAYLLDALGDAGGIGTYLAPNFGIQSFDLITTTTLRVTFKLLTGDTAKTGTINGKIQLYGKVNAGDGWTPIGAPVAPTFDNGTVTPADYTVSDTYRFFHPQIVP